jgi:hypothetical protein
VLAGKHDDDTWKANVSLPDLIEGLSINAEVFNIGAEYVSMMAARRESDVLLTEGHERPGCTLVRAMPRSASSRDALRAKVTAEAATRAFRRA